MGMGMGTGMGTGIPLLLLLLLVLRPTAGNVHDPLLILEGPEQGGIRLRCLSERPFSDVQLLWTDGKGENLTGIPAPTDTGSAGSSLLLRPGSGNAASCRILDLRLRTASESSVVVADVFFPATSPWLPAFLMLLVLGVFLLLAAAYKLRRNQQLLARERKNQQQIQEEIEELKEELEEEIGKFQKENQEMEKKIGRVQAQLEFRLAQSNAVSLTLDKHCKHPDLVIQGKSRIVTSKPGSKIHPKAVVVAQEGFSEGKHYWEVEVGDGSDWELGVLGEEIRDSLRNNGRSFAEEKVPGLEYSQGKFCLPGGKVEHNSGSCRVVGVLLDQESCALSFFDAEEKQLLGVLPLKLPGSLFPFFSPSSDGNALGIRPVGVGEPRQ
ncbi:butyrophilin-like protein 9 [Cyanocitta cristata]